MRHGILCHNKIKELNLTHADLSDPDVQQRRRFNQDFKNICEKDKSLHDYTNLYWTAKNAMMAKLICNQQANKIVILKINANRLLKSKGWIISDGNAAANMTKFYRKEDPEISLRFSEVRQTTFKLTSENAGENKRRMCAEFLFPEVVNADFIDQIASPTSIVDEKVKDILSKINKFKIRTVEPNLFFRFNKVGSGVRMRFGNVSLYRGDSFSSDADAIVISTNTVGVMADPRKVLEGKGGLAGTYRLKCPFGYLHFRKLCKDGIIRIGQPAVVDFHEVTGVTDILSIENNDLYQRYHIYFPTKIKPSYQEKSDLQSIKDGLIYLRKDLEKLEIKKISMPALGCGLGGLDFIKDVLPVIIFQGNKFINKNGAEIEIDLFMPQNEKLLTSHEEYSLTQKYADYIKNSPDLYF